MCTDFFGRAVNPGDMIWIPGIVTSVAGGVITVTYTNEDESTTTLTATCGSNGSVTNPAEGDRPPR
jgi:hypothetical protein